MADEVTRILTALFRDVSPGQLATLRQVMTTRSCTAGEQLFEAGDTAECIYIVLDGRFAVHKPVGIGQRTQVVGLLGPGAAIGEAAAVGNRKRSARVAAVENSELAVLCSDALQELEQQDPGLVLQLLKHFLAISSLRLQKSSERLALVL